MNPINHFLGYSPIDIHSHFDHNVPGDRKDPTGTHPFNTPKNQFFLNNYDLDFLKEDYDQVGIGCGAFSTYASLLRDDRIKEENNYLFHLTTVKDWVYQWVVVHPEQPDTLLQAEKLLSSSKVLGIKIHPFCHHYDIAQYGDMLFSFANEHQTAVLMHPDRIESISDFANRYPNVQLIIAHLSTQDHICAVKQAKLGNIYVDTSGMASYQNNVIEYAVNKIGAEHILFGTDTYSTAFQLGRIAWAQITDSEKKLILRDNANRLFCGKF